MLEIRAGSGRRFCSASVEVCASFPVNHRQVRDVRAENPEETALMLRIELGEKTLLVFRCYRNKSQLRVKIKKEKKNEMKKTKQMMLFPVVCCYIFFFLVVLIYI